MKKKKTNTLIFPLLVMGVFLIFVISCQKDNVPVLTTLVVSEITQTTATSGGNISSDGGTPITTRGMCWSTEQTPTISDNKKIAETSLSNYPCSIVGLSANTTYYVRAFATNSNGPGYGNTMVFTTEQGGSSGIFTDFRDNNVYRFVTIGNQVWMAENLKYLPKVSRPYSYSTTSPHYYVYGYDGTNVNEAKATNSYKTYGVLYNWPAAMRKNTSSTANPSGVQGVCPIGWHLPSDTEWTQLTDYLGGETVAGGKLKATGTLEAGTGLWHDPNNGATNETDFTALPSGYCDCYRHSFWEIGYYTYWWSSTEDHTESAWYRGVYYNYGPILKNTCGKEFGDPVRCVRD